VSKLSSSRSGARSSEELLDEAREVFREAILCAACAFAIEGLHKASCDKTQHPSPDWKRLHRLFVLAGNIGQSQITIDRQTFLLRVTAEQLQFWADDSLAGQKSDDLMLGLRACHTAS
jgi:hypothetical protein